MKMEQYHRERMARDPEYRAAVRELDEQEKATANDTGKVIDLMAALKEALAKRQRCDRCLGAGSVISGAGYGSLTGAKCDKCDGKGFIVTSEAPDA